ncbi:MULTISPECIES: hypothetical protein [unclassified Variovorax]|uniref:hypothetical protein n=1 Tax=unclassified Variovorax TaxID=663243 RepID=UPI002578862B|nr:MULTISPECIES: hypothetical protein [unclassified Variovorax]MDM0086971.1 hypothetical protein [Variovorax sp. J22G40]MDM0144772.1 hypothetical protein [Variovorax sp. J2P1-31]
MNRKHLNFPPPPVPRTVRELLKVYPELIEELQEALTSLHYGPRGPMDFERAVWLLKDMLEADWVDARDEGNQAKARDQLDAIQRAETKKIAVNEAMRTIHAGDDLWDYFKTYEKEFQ